MKRKIEELQRQIEHILFRLEEDRRCFARKCPVEDPESELDRLMR